MAKRKRGSADENFLNGAVDPGETEVVLNGPASGEVILESKDGAVSYYALTSESYPRCLRVGDVLYERSGEVDGVPVYRQPDF